MEQGKEPPPPPKSVPCLLTPGNSGALSDENGQGFDWDRSFNLNINITNLSDLLKPSSVGYHPQYMLTAENYCLNIQ